MEYNELAERAHNNAVRHGFWETRHSNEHCMMLVVSEVAEMVEADRNSKRSIKPIKFINSIGKQPTAQEYATAFNNGIKDTLEDEMADIAIRLFDLAGAIGINFNYLAPSRYFRAFDRFTFCENAFGLVKGLTRDNIGIQKRVLFGLKYLETWAKQQNIDLLWHIYAKMQYNENRPTRHGKKY